MTNKAKEAKRLLIFIAMVFGIYLPLFALLNGTVGYDNWVGGKYGNIALMLMFIPAIASLLTRIITKEGMGQSGLHLRLNRHIRFYIAALTVPAVIMIVSALIFACVSGEKTSSVFGGCGSAVQKLSFLLNNIYAPVPITAFLCLGEELGWRAYMGKKLESLTGIAGTCVIGGIIRGLWYAPMIAKGLLFGNEYGGYPYIGILLVCLCCIFEGTALTWLTIKTESVYPAAIFRAVIFLFAVNINALPVGGFAANLAKRGMIKFFPVILIVYAVAGALCAVMMLAENKNCKAQTKN